MPRPKKQESLVPSEGKMYGNLDNGMGIEFNSLLAKDYVYFVKKYNNMGDVTMQKVVNINPMQLNRFINRKTGANAFEDGLKSKFGKNVFLLHDPTNKGE